MTSDFSQAKIYSTLAGLSDLKISAKSRSPEALNEVATQFEAMFMQMMLKTMRDANTSDAIFGSNQMQFYQDLYDKQISMHLSERKSMGIADILIKQLGGLSEKSETQSQLNILSKPVAFPEVETVGKKKDDIKFDNPEDFINKLNPLAEKYAKELGVKPEVLLAQAALETGWGKKIIQSKDGNSFNLFGIKSSSNWEGESARVKTLEHKDGQMRYESSAFRAYSSFEDSFADYVSLIKNNSRYEKALDKTNNSSLYVKELQNAGYATDPHYAKKIISILKSNEFPTG